MIATRGAPPPAQPRRPFAQASGLPRRWRSSQRQINEALLATTDAIATTSVSHLSLRAQRGNLDDRNARRSAPRPAPAAVRSGIGIAASLTLLAMTD